MNDRDSDLKLALVERENRTLKESMDNLADALNAAENNLNRLTVIVENLSVKVGGLSDIAWKGGSAFIVALFSLLVGLILKK